jgi:serine/threonine protein phosphatase PrpC
VADGMGGHDAGDVASRKIVESLESIRADKPLAKRVDEIEDRIEAVNTELNELAREGQGGGTIGSTMVALVAEERVGVFLWAGDSRLYRLRGGNLSQITTDHSQVEYYISQGLLTREQAEHHPESHIITRAVGSHDDLQLDVDMLEMRPGDRLLLCTDGLMRHIPTAEVETLLAQGTPEECALELIDLTLQRGAKDNVTVIVLDVPHDA